MNSYDELKDEIEAFQQQQVEVKYDFNKVVDTHMRIYNKLRSKALYLEIANK